ncbi:MAG: type 4a pilus biogenesis protein PilO [Longimicrobiales bacterium]
MKLIPDDPKQKNALVVGLLFVVGLYLVNTYWRVDRLAEVEQGESRLEALENSNRSAEIIAARGGTALEERMAVYERHIAQLEALIPLEEQVASLLNDLTLLARDLGVELDMMRPEPSEPSDFYTKQTYSLRVIGEYHDVSRYITRVASLERIITPIDLALSLFATPDRFREYESPVQAEFRIQTYVITSAESLSPGGGP